MFKYNIPQAEKESRNASAMYIPQRQAETATCNHTRKVRAAGEVVAHIASLAYVKYTPQNCSASVRTYKQILQQVSYLP